MKRLALQILSTQGSVVFASDFGSDNVLFLLEQTNTVCDICGCFGK